MSGRWLRAAAVAAVWVGVRDAEAQQGLRLSGQLGFRSEYIGDEAFAARDVTRDDDHRVRLRARVRLAGSYDVSDALTVGLRLSTGSGDYPSSAWSSLNDDFRRDAFSLDRAFARYRATPSLTLRAGIDENPLWTPTELVWDGDVSPGGVAEVVRRGGLELVAGQYMLREVRSSESANDEGAFLLAHGVSYRWGEGARYRVGAFNYTYTNPNALARAVASGELSSDYRTNRFDPGAPERYLSDFTIFGGSFSYGRGPWSLATEAAINAGAERDASLGPGYEDRERVAWAALLTYGTLSEPGTWSVSTGYFHIAADAVPAPFNSDDVQQTNVRTLPVWVRLRLGGGADLVWDSYLQSKLDRDLASPGGIVHPENATKLRTRLTVLVNFE